MFPTQSWGSLVVPGTQLREWSMKNISNDIICFITVTTCVLHAAHSVWTPLKPREASSQTERASWNASFSTLKILQKTTAPLPHPPKLQGLNWYYWLYHIPCCIYQSCMRLNSDGRLHAPPHPGIVYSIWHRARPSWCLVNMSQWTRPKFSSFIAQKPSILIHMLLLLLLTILL